MSSASKLQGDCGHNSFIYVHHKTDLSKRIGLQESVEPLDLLLAFRRAHFLFWATGKTLGLETVGVIRDRRRTIIDSRIKARVSQE